MINVSKTSISYKTAFFINKTNKNSAKKTQFPVNFFPIPDAYQTHFIAKHRDRVKFQVALVLYRVHSYFSGARAQASEEVCEVRGLTTRSFTRDRVLFRVFPTRPHGE